MWSCGREVRVGTTRGKDVYLDCTLPCPDPAGQHQGCPRPRPVTSLFSQVPRVRTQPGGGARSSVTPSPVTDVLWTCLTGLWIPEKVTVPTPPDPSHVVLK